MPPIPRLALFLTRQFKWLVFGLLFLGTIGRAEKPDAGYRIQLDTIRSGYDGIHCWVHPRVGVVPVAHGPPAIVLTMMQLWLKGSDVFGPINDMRSDDLGRTWSGPREHTDTLGERRDADNTPILPNDFWPKWHAQTGKLLGIGHTVYYDEKDGVRSVKKVRPRQTSYSVYDPIKRTWSPWATLAMPDQPRFKNAGAGSAQRVDLPNGDILLPIYCKEPEQSDYETVVLRCRFDGTTLSVKEIGNALTVAGDRGLHEPSLAQIGQRTYLTLRNNRTGYVSASDDGLHFEAPRPWTWDDGALLGNYNTQQHWVTHNEKLYLVYTRKGANNDHVFRHRAPLFMAEVDRARLVVIRATERIVIPERGARLCNFGIAEISLNETWITVAEWMQTWGPNHVIPVDNPYGSNNSVYAARILWGSPAGASP